MELKTLLKIFKDQGTQSILIKDLSPNDNSKNQIYLGSDFSSLNILPHGDITLDQSTKGSIRDRFKASLNFNWVSPNGGLFPAPHAQLILYPKYPEVRLSGFLRESKHHTGQVLTKRDPGRMLVLAITSNNSILSLALSHNSPLTRAIRSKLDVKTIGVFRRLTPTAQNTDNNKPLLLSALREIYEKGWIKSQRMLSNGAMVNCNAPQCVGFTLEARLGVRPNSYSKPDYLGWEIKAHTVRDPLNPNSGGPITLMTPEPDGGFYGKEGVEKFIRKYGYVDKKGRADRLNYGGIHKINQPVTSTSLRLILDGYDARKGRISNVDGGICLVSESGEKAAMWSFTTLLEIWTRKHALAAYVCALSKKTPQLSYKYGPLITLGIGTDFGKFLNGVANGHIYYDPGLKLEQASSDKPKHKARSQFRIHPSRIEALYESSESVDLRT